jgi:glycosyltransferase involved in cell wall biosynthesis
MITVVDDGSTDTTATAVGQICDSDGRMELLCLSRHFGKEAAIHAGLMHASGNAVIVMDGDLQHPPELIPEMVALWRKQLPVVEAVKQSRGREGLFSRITAHAFYRVFAVLAGFDIRNHTDFKLLDRKVVDTYLALPERQRFFRGLVSWMGFPSAQIPFDVPARPHGERRFTLLRRVDLSTHAISSFTSLPLQIITYLGGITLMLALVFGSISLYQKFSGLALSGFTTVILLLLIIGSAVMIGLGVIGIYISQIYHEVKSRPEWLIDKSRSRLHMD